MNSTTEIRRATNALSQRLVDVTSQPDLDGVLAAAGLDYEVALHDLQSQVVTSEGVTRVDYIQSGVVRMDTLAPLGVVGERYTPIQNRDAFEPLRYLHDEGFIEGFEQAGVLGAGQRAFIIARLAKDISVTDEHHARVLFVTSHDGSGSYAVRALAERLFCRNQIPRLTRMGTGIMSIRHTQSAGQRVQQVRSAVMAEIKWFDEYAEQYDRMLNTPVQSGRVGAFLNQVAPMPPKDATDRQIRAGEKRQQDLVARIYGVHNTNIEGTVAALFQGAVEYSDYDARGNNADRILLGRDLKFKQRAWESALALL